LVLCLKLAKGLEEVYLVLWLIEGSFQKFDSMSYLELGLIMSFCFDHHHVSGLSQDLKDFGLLQGSIFVEVFDPIHYLLNFYILLFCGT